MARRVKTADNGRNSRGERAAGGVQLDYRLLLDAKTLAAALSISARQVEYMLRDGDIPAPSVRIGRKRLWKIAVVKEWIESGCPGNGQRLPIYDRV